jgi:hypothetical protein
VNQSTGEALFWAEEGLGLVDDLSTGRHRADAAGLGQGADAVL